MVNDGSTDATESIAREYPFQVISTSNRGLSEARNTGLNLATGEIVAYTDDDAYPDPHWLNYLADMFLTTSHAGIGGPNLPPPDDGWIAECVANAPGGPIHVLLDDQTAEHIPGCNMAFRKESLISIGGFDPRFRSAGDDVDICWRLQEKGWTLGFHPSALVWHHRRNSVRTYWRQQQGYGKAEALLEKKWPQKYNVAGHLSWKGRLYGKGSSKACLWSTSRIYQGVWGSAPFQLMYQADPSHTLSILSMPEWSLAIVALAGLSIAGLLIWTPLLMALPILLCALGTAGFVALRHAYLSPFDIPNTTILRTRSKLLTAGLHLLQPIARLTGRFASGLTPWRTCLSKTYFFPWRYTFTAWTEHWQALPDRLEAIETTIGEKRFAVQRGGEFDRWDLHVKPGILGGTRVRMMIEEHGAGKQMIRCRTWPTFSRVAIACTATLSMFCVWAFMDQGWAVGTLLAGCSLLLGLRAQQEYSSATLAVQEALSLTVQLNTQVESAVVQEKALFTEPVLILE